MFRTRVWLLGCGCLVVASCSVAATDAEPTGAVIRVERMKAVAIPADKVYPAELRGGTAFTFVEVPSHVNIELGALEFTVQTTGLVYLLAHWQYEGNRSGGWTDERLTKEQLVERGWEEVGPSSWDKEVFWFRRNCEADEKHRIRTNKYWPPYPYSSAPLATTIAATRSANARPTKPVTDEPKSISRDEPAVQPSGGHAIARKKLAPPDTEAEKRSAALVSQVFKAEWEKAKTTEQRSGLARKILQTGCDTKGDDAGRYVLFCVARDAAAKENDLKTSLQAIDELDAAYEVDTLAMRVDVLSTAASVKRGTKDTERFADLADKYAQEAVARDRYDLAKSLAGMALAAAKTARNPKLRSLALARQNEVEAIAAAFVATQDSRAALDANPADSAPNLAVGCFYCFMKRDWGVGIPMLALGTDDDLRTVAAADLSGAEKAEDRVAVGDKWWDLAENADTIRANAMRHRAAHWYSLAVSELSGLVRAKVEQRLQIVGPPKNDDAREKASPQSKKAVPASLVPGLTLDLFERLPSQKGDDGFVEIGKLGSPVGERATIESLESWNYDATKNAVAYGFLKIERRGRYGFQTYNFYDRNALYVNGVLVCPYRGSVAGGSEPAGMEFIDLRPGLVPIASVGYVDSRGSVRVTWLPPGEKKFVPIPKELLFRKAADE